MAARRTELRETRSDVLALPILIGVLIVVIVIRMLFVHPLQTVVFIVCGAAAVLDVLFTRFLLQTGAATLAVTADEITFTPRQGKDFEGAKPQVSTALRRAR